MVTVIGANGLLGNFILQKFNSEGAHVVGLKRVDSDTSFSSKNIEWRNIDITNSLSLSDALKDSGTVIHTAGVVSFDPRAKQRLYNTNVIGTQNVVNACIELGIPRLIFISSVAALGRKKGMTEIDEHNKWVDSDLNSDYAKSKYLAELEVYRGHEEGLSVSVICPAVILSIANPNKSSAQIFKYVQQERPFYSDGLINYVDVRDVADLVYSVYDKNLFGEKFIASAGAVELREIISKIAVRLNKKVPSIKINSNLLRVAAWIEEMKGRIMAKESLISRQSVKISGERFTYQNQKSIDRLNMTYRPLEETLDWCCEYYRKAFTINK